MVGMYSTIKMKVDIKLDIDLYPLYRSEGAAEIMNEINNNKPLGINNGKCRYSK